MTIDVHCHLFVREFYSESFWDWTAHNWNWTERSRAARSATSLSPEEVWAEERAVLPTYWDPEGTRHLRRMDDAGIEKAVMQHMDMGLLFGEADMTIEQQNRHVGQVAKEHPDRLLWFCGADPRREGAAELLETCVTQWGARGVKLYPGTGFLPADREVYPIYERASAWKVPVLFHMGHQPAPFKNEGNFHPSTLLRVLVDFPNLVVIVAHMGFSFWRDLIALGKVRENVMCDFVAWQNTASQNYGQFCHILRRFLDQFGTERVMFGTDAPSTETMISSKEWVEIVKALPHKSPKEYSFTEEEVAALLDGNARRLLTC